MRGLTALLLWAAVSSCAPRQHPSALLITLDTTRADALGCYGGATPEVSVELDGLARRGVLFENAHTVAPLTLPAHASMLTGLYPPVHGIRNNGARALPCSARTLAEAAQEAGFQTAAFLAAVVLDRAFGLDQGFETYSAPVNPALQVRYEFACRPARAVIDEALAWLGARDRARPFFLWIHLFDPHQPYDPPPEFLALSGGNDYLGEIAAMDREIGRLLDQLEAEGLLKSTALLVVADHGEALGEHGEPSHGLLCYEPTLRVPCLLVRPDGARAGERSRAPVSVADVAPTLAEAMGVTLSGLDGRSLWSGDPPAERGVYFESYMGYLELGTSPLAGWLDGQGKYLESSSPELYRLDSDPLEQRNEIASAPVEPYRTALARTLARPPLAPETGEVDESVLAGIRALGYAAGAIDPALPSPLERSARPSPQERTGALAELVVATGLFDRGQREEALAIARRVARESPDTTRALALEATCLIALRRSAEAIEPLQRYLQLCPGKAADHYNLGACLKDAGRTEEAVASFQRALELEPAKPGWFPAFLEYLRRSGMGERAAELEARHGKP